MKRILQALLLITSISAYAQYTPVNINFESVTNSMIKIDTTQPNNLWQIGAPHKVLFDSALSAPNVIVTDTANTYPINNTSSFQFTIYDSLYILGMGDTWAFNGTFITFWQKLDTDTLRDGGYIEYSIDSGATFTNIANLFPYIYNGDTLFNGTPGFTGKARYISSANQWQQIQFHFTWCFGTIAFPIPHSVILRFTFKSDSINNNREGWMIDDLSIATWACEGIKEQSNAENVRLFPNPATASFTIESTNKIECIKVVNVLGKVMYQQPTTNNQPLTIDISSFAKGVYFVEITDEAKAKVNKKLVVE